MKKIKAFIYAQLTQGVSPHHLALTVSLALACGTFPIIGSTTLLCFLAAVIFHLNQPAIQSVNYLLAPLQIILIPIFLMLGQKLVGEAQINFNFTEFFKEFFADPVLFFQHYGPAALHAILAWFLLAPVAAVAAYFICVPIFKKIQIKVWRIR